MGNRYFALSESERLAIETDAELHNAICLEAIERGIRPPMSINEKVERGVMVGYMSPPQSITLYEIVRPSDYGTADTGVCFKTLEEAQNAMNGAFAASFDTYGKKQHKIHNGEWSVKAISIGESGCFTGVKIEEYDQDDSEFDKIKNECISDLSSIRQKAYDKAVNARKREEYLRLANGDEEIAKAFWSRTERIEWPTAS